MRHGAMFAALTAALVIMGGAAAGSRQVKAANSIEKIMELTHTTDKGLRDRIYEEAVKDKPDWVSIQKMAKQFNEELAHLPKLSPPNGGKDSWAKKTKAYIDMSKGFETAADKKDAKGIKDAYDKTGMVCKACHDDHR